MNKSIPYACPPSRLSGHDEVQKLIDSLDVSEKWKERFHAIAAAGGPKMPGIKTVPKDVRKKALSFNIPAFLFGPLYFVSKGMWKRGVTMFSVLLCASILVGLMLERYGFDDKYARALGYGVAAVFAVRANVDYYKKMVLKDNGWI